MNKIVTISVIAAVILFIGFYVLFKVVARSETLTGLTIAENGFTFLNKTKDPNGGFYYKFDCEIESGDCIIGEPYDPIGHSLRKMPPHFGHLILAFRDMGKKTNNATYTETANSATDFILAQCQKDDDYCLWNFSPLSVYYNETKDSRYKNAMLKVSDQLLQDHSVQDHLALNAGIKLRSLYEITGDKRYLALLIKNADAIVDGALEQEINPKLYTDNGFSVRGIMVKAIWADILPAYMATKDEKYLTFSRNFLAKAHLSDNLDKVKISNKLELSSYALDSLWQLSSVDASSKELYLAEARKIAQYVLSFADTPRNKKYNRDYGFVENGVKDPLINGWIVRQFIRLSSDSFSF